jgi:hypothetical protein
MPPNRGVLSFGIRVHQNGKRKGLETQRERERERERETEEVRETKGEPRS